MNKFEFRGKDIETGNWVYGSLFDHLGHYPEIIVSRPDKNGKVTYDRIAVSPESVSMYTGMNDSKGQKIFSKDIIAVRLGACFEKDGSLAWEEEYTTTVRGIDSAFAVDLPESHDFEITSIYWLAETVFNTPELEVIGNIIDNQELHPAKDNAKTFDGILEFVKEKLIETRRECLVPVLLQDRKYTPEERVQLAEIGAALTEIERKINKINDQRS